jgi:hypothetical protein
MRSVWLTLFLCAFVVWPSITHAQKVTDGNYLLGSCQITVRVADEGTVKLDKYEAWRDGYCRGIVEGLLRFRL